MFGHPQKHFTLFLHDLFTLVDEWHFWSLIRLRITIIVLWFLEFLHGRLHFSPGLLSRLASRLAGHLHVDHLRLSLLSFFIDKILLVPDTLKLFLFSLDLLSDIRLQHLARAQLVRYFFDLQ